MKSQSGDFENYISPFPEEVKSILKEMRKIIKEVAPDAIEGMSYGMPAFKLNGLPLVYFAGYKNHIGFYATPSGHTQFTEALSKYKQGKGSVQFPLDQPIPWDLIKEIVAFRVKENLAKPKKKSLSNV